MDITVEELHRKFESKEPFVLIDVREPHEFEEFNLGGQLVPLGELMNRAWELEDNKDKEVVVYCRSGNRSGMAKSLLTAQGFTNVRNLLGGVMAWQDVYGKQKP